MKETSVADTLQQIVAHGMMPADEAQKRLHAYSYYQAHLSEITEAYYGRWVAVLNDHLFVANSQVSLNDQIKDQPDRKYAILIYVGGM